MSETLHFKISSGLKNIIGKELINDKFIAIFELVKNSYDADAKSVHIRFEDIYSNHAKIIIFDDGKGMTKNDILNKWLFVAYSEKKNQTYRDNLTKRRSYAGAKGVGRFSCDRLGENVELLSKTKHDKAVHVIKINWNDFENRDEDEFNSIDVKYDLLDNNYFKNSGTRIVISNLRELWNRTELLGLKKALTQLVNPDATVNYDAFEIILDVEDEIENDNKEKRKKIDDVVKDKDIVNGKIVNHVFEALNIKTTKIEVIISDDGKTIKTLFNDRGIKLFELVEKNRYSLHSIKGVVYVLNQAAKNNFTRIMGIQPVNYGSIFIYKNGFRVYPYGEPEKDFFNVDRRKAQGFRRYFGTRDITGRLDIYGNNPGFIETSSRNNGFINSYEITELEEFFYEYILKPLEKYVVNIIHWGEALVDKDSFAKDMEDYKSSDAILKKIKPKYKKEDVIKIDFNDDIIKAIDERKVKPVFKELNALKNLANESDDNQLLEQTTKVEKKAKELERRFEETQKEAQQVVEKHEEVQRELAATKRQVGVLQSRVDVSADDAVNAMHIMKAYADSIDSNIEEIFEIVRTGLEMDEMTEILHEMRQTCSKIMNAYNLVINTEYNADTGNKDLDIVKFTKNYVERQWSHKFNISIQGKKEVNIYFNPLEFSIIIDNIIDNAIKANANKVDIIFEKQDMQTNIIFRNDGFGLENEINTCRLFEQGYTTTKGTGIGLFTVRTYVNKMKGEVWINPQYKSGFELHMRF